VTIVSVSVAAVRWWLSELLLRVEFCVCVSVLDEAARTWCRWAWSPGGRRGRPEVKCEKEMESVMRQRNLASEDAVHRNCGG
jgi:hypothetical protein